MDLCRLQSPISPIFFFYFIAIWPEKGGYTGIHNSTIPDIAVKDAARAATAHNRSILFFEVGLAVYLCVCCCVYRVLFYFFFFQISFKRNGRVYKYWCAALCAAKGLHKTTPPQKKKEIRKTR